MVSAPAPLRGFGTGRRTLTVVIALLAVLVASLVPAPASAARVRSDLERRAEEGFLDLHANARSSRGIPAQLEYRDIREVARSWSDQMADRNRMAHNDDYARQVCCHRKVAENVAHYWTTAPMTTKNVDTAVRSLFDDLMASSGHRSNILDSRTRQLGIGVTLRPSGNAWHLWATMNFREPDGSEPDRGVPTPRDIADTCGTDDNPGFRDVDRSNAHSHAIACIENAGIASGRSDGTYGAKDLLSRGQVATFLLRTLEASGIQRPSERPCRGTPHADSVSAMIAWNVFTDGSCNEDRSVTRTDMATWTTRAIQGVLGMPLPASQWDHFVDDNGLSGNVQGGHNAMADLGVVTGVGNEHFAPGDLLRRDQMATFLARLWDAAEDR